MRKVVLRAGLSALLVLAGCAEAVEESELASDSENVAEGEDVDLAAHDAELSAPAGSSAWVARHDLTGAQYQLEFDKWTGLGYRPTYVSGYAVGGSARYAAVWDKAPGAPMVARHGLTAAQYQAEFNKWTQLGYRPVLVNGYGVGATDYYVALFEKSSAGGAWVARHGLTGAQYQTEFNNLTGQGYRPLHISAYTVAGQPRFAAIWVRTAGPAWVARHGMTSSQYQTEFNAWVAQGYQLTKVSGYASGGSARYAAVWEKVGNAPPWAARHDLSSSGYQTEFDDLRYQGYRPVVVAGFDVGGSARFAAIWVNVAISGANLAKIDAIVSKHMKPGPTVGLSFALTRGGRLVFAKGYGVADKSNGAAVHASSMFRIASVSKPITAAAIMRLVETGRLGLDERVFGAGAVLGTRYGNKAYSSALRKITVRHLLTHTVGEFTWSNQQGAGDPMFQRTDLNTASGWNRAQQFHQPARQRPLTRPYAPPY
jgi:hypothetical protein